MITRLTAHDAVARLASLHQLRQSGQIALARARRLAGASLLECVCSGRTSMRRQRRKQHAPLTISSLRKPVPSVCASMKSFFSASLTAQPWQARWSVRRRHSTRAAHKRDQIHAASVPANQATRCRASSVDHNQGDKGGRMRWRKGRSAASERGQGTLEQNRITSARQSQYRSQYCIGNAPSMPEPCILKGSSILAIRTKRLIARLRAGCHPIHYLAAVGQLTIL